MLISEPLYKRLCSLRTITLITFLLFSSVITYISSVFSEPPDPVKFECIREVKGDEARRVIILAQNSYKKINNLTSNFTQDSYLSALDISEKSSGKVWFSKPGKMRWYYEKPEEQVFLVLDKTVWLYQVGEKQVLVDQFTNILISDLPVAFLLGIGDLSNDFTLERACEVSNPQGILLELTPKKRAASGSDKGLERFDLVVDLRTNLPLGARIRDVGGNLNSIVMQDVKSDTTIDNSLFKAEFPSGTDIDDRRIMFQEIKKGEVTSHDILP